MDFRQDEDVNDDEENLDEDDEPGFDEPSVEVSVWAINDPSKWRPIDKLDNQ